MASEYEFVPFHKRKRGWVVDAHYHPHEGYLVVVLNTAEGRRFTYMHFSIFLFGGRKAEDAPRAEVDREMEKTAELFRKNRGRCIFISTDESPKERS